MRRGAILVLVCLLAGLDVQAGREYTARSGEQVVANEFIIRLMPGATADAVIARYLPGAQIQALRHDGFFRIRVPGGLPAGISARIAADLQVDFVEPTRIRHAVVAAPNDPNYGSSWWFPAVQALQAWSLLPGQYTTAATAGTGRVKVAVLDTGADCTHPDFINTGGTSTDSAQGGQLMFNASRAIVHTTIVNPVCPWQDDHGHGTHVTGIVAAATSNALGVSGLGYPVQVIEFKVLNSAGSGNDPDIMNAIEAAADAGAQVVSMSLGEVGYSPTLQTAINYAWQRNTLVVSAAGNDGSSELFFPAGANHAVGVSATDSGNNAASFSNFGNAVQLAAPGVGIFSTTPTYSASQGWPLNYASLSGTSMATPFVAALAGLVAMTTPNATAAAILQRMEQTASSVTAGGGWNQNFGFGLISASGAVAGTLRAAVNGAITGQILDQFGNPISGAQITINSQTITTDPTGSDTTGLYRFSTIPAGTYPVTVTAPNKPTQSLNVTVAPGADTPLTVTMGVTYSKFTGTVTDQGLGVSGAIVQTLSGGLITAMAVADQSGQYTLWVPGSGTYDVRASQIGRVTTTLSGLTLSPGGTTTANLALPRMGTIAGSVRDGSQNPVANAQVLVTGGSFSGAAATDSNGNYSLIAVPTGTQFSATATATGFLASTQNGIAVAADATTNVNFTMASSVVATPTFTPPAGAYSSTQSVTISTATSGASIRYTTDGSTPTSSVGTPYNSNTPVSVSSNLTLKAIAYMNGMTDSAVASAAYTITSGGGGTGTPWYNSSWTNRKAVIIDHTKVSANLTNFPLLFSVTDANLKTVANGGEVGKLDGTDLLFTDSTGTFKINHELESYTPATGQVAAWVQVPSISSTVDTVIYVYFGNPSAADQQNKTGVWDSNFKGVWHLNNSSSPATDSTLNGTSAGTRSGTPVNGVPGEIGNGTSFSAGAELATNNAVNLSSSSTATLEAWVNGNLLNDAQEILNFGTFGITPTSLEIAVQNGGATNWGPGLVLGLGTSALNKQYAPAPSSNAWHHIVATYDTTQPASSEMKLYVDGVAQTLTTWAGYNHDSSGTLGSAPLYISGYAFNWYQWTGKLDEVRISNLIRPSAWIAAEYSNQGAPTAFFSQGSLESPGALPVATPTFTPPAGAYGSTQSVTISTATSGASIRYTTDGSAPTSSVGTPYNSNTPVSVSSNLTLKAIAYMAGMTDSAVASAAYTIPVATPTFTPPAGSYGSTQSVSIITATSGASIRYTTDGSTPTSSVGTPYNSNTPVSVSSNLTLKAIAYMNGMTDSAVAAGTYTITIAGPVSVPMSQYNFDRTGANLSEQVLNTSNVNPAQFGKLFSRVVDDSVYALPLIIPNLTIAGGVHDVLFVATMNNSVYAFDAVDPSHTQPYWSVNLGTPGVGGSWIGPVNFGILSTPFIEAATNTMYVVAEVQNGGDVGLYIFALDITTGQTKYNSPRRMSFTFPAEGITLTNVEGGIQRAGLLVSNGVLYVAVANIVPNDHESQEGFVQSFDAHNLSNQLGTVQATPSATEGKGGIWEAGRGLPVDASGVYFSVAGGAYSAATNPPNLGSSIVKVAPSTLNIQDWFAPQNWQYLFDNNVDPAAGGVTLIPGTSLLFAGGKEGVIYLLNRNNMGHLEGTDGQPMQRFQASYGCAQNTAAPDCSQTLGTSYWDRGGSGMLYVWDKTDVLRAYPFNGQTFNTVTPQVGTLAVGMTGGPSLSANGADLSSAIIWAVTTTSTDPGDTGPGTLRAYRADNITQELYNSDVNQVADSVGTLTKFAPPVVANGRVYVSTQSNMVQVYGLVSAGGPTSQTITFGPLANKTIEAAPFTIGATASSGLPVSFDSLTAAVCTVAGNSVTILAVGTCSIRATEPGNAIYSPATPVIQSFSVNPVAQTATPTFTPPAGSYSSTQSVTISTATSGASIRYTTDGSTPTSSVGTPYNSNTPVSVSSNLTLKAIAYMAGMTDSAVASAAYAIQVATPTFNPPAGTYSSTQSVTISTTTPGASIRYTTDGSAPTSSTGTPYNSNTPVSVSSNLTLKAIAYMAGMTNSAVASAAYTITSGGGGGGQTWYNPSWTNRKAVTIDHTKVSGASSLTNFPMLFSVTDANLKTVANGGSVGKSDGTDLLFTDSTGTFKINHELESYNPATGQVSAWVQVPSVSPTADTVLYIYFGNPSAADQQNKTGVWDSNFKGVWHLSNSSSPATDSTSSGNSAATRNGSPTYGTPGEIGNGIGFGSGAELVTNSPVNLSSSTATVEAWVNGNLLSDGQEVLNFGTFGITPAALEIAVQNNGGTNWGPALVVGLEISGQNKQYAPAPSSNAWHHVVATYDTTQPASNEMKLYVDGVAQTLTTYSSYNNDNSGTLGSAALYISGYAFNWYQWTGKLDEVRISNLVRPSAWVATEYSNQSAPTAFFSVGSLTSPGPLPVATPTFNPPAGVYSSTQSVTISTATSGASIRYTTDGSTPTSSVGTPYNSNTPVSVSSNLTLKAIAYMAGMTDSAVASAAYAIQVATPTFNPPAGTYSSTQSVTISTTTPGASIRYTTDGSAPTSSTGTPYNSNTPVSVSSNLTLKAIAYMAGMTNSAVASAAYTITSGGGGGGQTWYNPSWTNRKAVTIDHTKVSGASSLTNFPMLFSVTDANLKTVANGGSVGKSDGTDLLFTDSTGTFKINHELESYNPATGQVSAWVQVPSVSPTADTVLYIYFGNPSAADQQNKTGVWDSNFKGVWHLSNSSSPATDSTSSGNSAATRNGSPTYGTPGEIGNGIGFGSGAELVTNSPVNLSSSTATVEAWVNGNLLSDGQEVLNFGTFGITPAALEIAVQNNGGTNWGPALVVGLEISGQNKQYAPAPSSNAWHHVVATYDTTQPASNEMKLYVDGVAQTLTTYSSYNNDNSGTLGSAALYISGYAFNWYQWTGKLDEVRISNLVRPSAWVATEYSNQSAPTAFFSVGPMQ